MMIFFMKVGIWPKQKDHQDWHPECQPKIQLEETSLFASKNFCDIFSKGASLKRRRGAAYGQSLEKMPLE